MTKIISLSVVWYGYENLSLLLRKKRGRKALVESVPKRNVGAKREEGKRELEKTV
jgi:hypothetical protein